jgi:hypothetical protein
MVLLARMQSEMRLDIDPEWKMRLRRKRLDEERKQVEEERKRLPEERKRLQEIRRKRSRESTPGKAPRITPRGKHRARHELTVTRSAYLAA